MFLKLMPKYNNYKCYAKNCKLRYNLLKVKTFLSYLERGTARKAYNIGVGKFKTSAQHKKP